MSVTVCRFALTTDKSKVLQSLCAIAIFTGALFPPMPSDAGSSSAQFSVSVRVEISCRVSASSLASQATSTNQTVNVKCSTTSAPINSTDNSMVGSSLLTGSANVNYSIIAVSGADGDFKQLNLNF